MDVCPKETSETMGISRLEELSQKMNAAKQAMHSDGQEAFMSAARGVFDKHPKLESVSWRQYTPYFNDGDACTFGVHAEYPDIVFAGEDIEYSSWRCDEHYSPEVNAAMADMLPVLKFLSDNEELAELAFGDHVEVIVTRDMVSTQEYSHD